MSKFIMLFLFLTQASSNSNNEGITECHCLDIITKTEITTKDEFVNCIKLLALNSLDSEKIYSKLEKYWKNNLGHLVEPLELLSFSPSNYEKYDFKEEPEEIHRLRAVKEILGMQLERGRISSEILIETFQQNENEKFLSFVLYKNQFYSDKFQDYLFQIATKNNSSGSNQLRLQNQIFDLLVRINPTKYLDEIFNHYLLFDSSELDIKILRYLGRNNIDSILDLTKERMISELSQRVFSKSKSDLSTYNELLALDRLLSTSENLSKRFDSMRALLQADHQSAYIKMKLEIEKHKNNY